MSGHPYVMHYNCYSCRRCRLYMWWRYSISRDPAWRKTAAYYLARNRNVPDRFLRVPVGDRGQQT